MRQNILLQAGSENKDKLWPIYEGASLDKAFVNESFEWMNEWMNEWMIEWMNEWMNEWMIDKINDWMNNITEMNVVWQERW